MHLLDMHLVHIRVVGEQVHDCESWVSGLLQVTKESAKGQQVLVDPLRTLALKVSNLKLHCMESHWKQYYVLPL